MPLQIIRADITKMKVDAIVNAANSTLLGGGGVDGAIHRAAGPELLKECRTLGGCAAGDAKITKGYNLPAKYVIHTVGPIWRDGTYGEPEILASAYRSSLELADAYHCESVAFPLISAGAYGCPRKTALSIAVNTIGEYVLEHDLNVFLVIYDKKSFEIGSSWFGSLQTYIDDAYVREQMLAYGSERRYQTTSFASYPAKKKSRFPGIGMGEKKKERKGRKEETETSFHRPEAELFSGYAKREEFEADMMAPNAAPMPQYAMAPAEDLEDRLRRLDESFSKKLLRMIDERGMKDSECYKKANIDRKHFSKIRKDEHYRPKKTTVLAFCIALELTLPQTRAFLEIAGYALSHANVADMIVEFFIERGNYNIFEINEALFHYDQNLLGS